MILIMVAMVLYIIISIISLNLGVWHYFRFDFYKINYESKMAIYFVIWPFYLVYKIIDGYGDAMMTYVPYIDKHAEQCMIEIYESFSEEISKTINELEDKKDEIRKDT